MIAAHGMSTGRMTRPADAGDLGLALWIDLFEPTDAEARSVEALVALDLPTREEMEEIELSSRLYSGDGAAFMTAIIPAQVHGDAPEMLPVTFVLAGARLVSIRYHDPSAFRIVTGRLEKGTFPHLCAEDVLVMLLEAVVDREADVLERAGREIDAISRRIFRRHGAKPTQPGEFQTTLEEIGRKGDLVSSIRDSLASLDRLSVYLSQVVVARGSGKGVREQVKTLSRDIRSIADHADSLSQKITFLLDATLGMIGIEQNAIIKIFSVAAVVFLPPTLIASIYGMNFAHMPELGWSFGYPAALGLMIVSAVLPYFFFKRRGWL
jgi:magnesium transporter